jgi:Ca-activated chloride channel family protein
LGKARRPASIAFVCDASGSMLGLPFDLLKQQIRVAVENLRPEQSFNIILFRKGVPRPLSARELLAADEKNKAEAYAWLAAQDVASISDPIPSLRLAFAQGPEVIYLLTDGGFDNNDAVIQQIARMNAEKRTCVHTIAFLSPDAPAAEREKCARVLGKIASENGGRFKVVLTTSLTGN